MKKIYPILSIFLLIFYAVASYGQVDHWEAAVRSDQDWKYFPGSADPGIDWQKTGFDDSAWLSGKGGFGYGDNDDSTVLDQVVSVFLRKTFTISDLSKIEELVLNMDYDDGFVAYINGAEVARGNIGEPGIVPSYDAFAFYAKEARLYQGLSSEEYRFAPVDFGQFLVNGENLLAVQVHNNELASSDLSCIPNLLVGINDSGNYYFDLPAWLPVPYDFSTSELPIVMINTNGQPIDDDIRIQAEMDVIDNGPGKENKISDPINGYSGFISIEYRGESASEFPKKSYSLETQEADGSNRNYPLLGFPDENDWVFYGPYSDKTLIRNVFAYHFSNVMGRYASRSKFIDLFINGDYKGMYVLIEKIKRDKNRVDIATLNPDDATGDQLTGGYILRIDKTDDTDYPPWNSDPSPSLPDERDVNLQYFDPDGWELIDVQKNYIRSFIHDFESALSSDQFTDRDSGYKKFVDVGSFVDHLILTEMTKNVDGYFYSTYMYKDRDEKGGKLTMGPAWDFNISLGNVDYAPHVLDTAGWLYEDEYRVYWFRRMIQDEDFVNKLNCRYHELRGGRLSDEVLFGYIDSLQNAISLSAEKNFRKWNILGMYVWPNAFVGETYAQEMNYLRGWLKGRLKWMDENISQTCVVSVKRDYLPDFKVYPNPVSDRLTISLGTKWDQVDRMHILDMNGRVVYQADRIDNAIQELDLKDINVYQTGIYILYVHLKNGTYQTSKFVKK